MSKEKSPEVRAEIDLTALMNLVKNGTCSIRLDGKKVALKLDVSDLDDEDQEPLWQNIVDDAQDKVDELANLDVNLDVDDDLEDEDDDEEEGE